MALLLIVVDEREAERRVSVRVRKMKLRSKSECSVSASLLVGVRLLRAFVRMWVIDSDSDKVAAGCCCLKFSVFCSSVAVIYSVS